MADLILIIIGMLIATVVYLVMTVHRHERALQYFQDEIQRQSVATWDDLTGGE